MKMKKTSRGFKIYSGFTDCYGSKIRVQESSIATKDCVWIFCNNDTGHFSDPSPHLTVSQAKQVIKGLKAFIKDKE